VVVLDLPSRIHMITQLDCKIHVFRRIPGEPLTFARKNRILKELNLLTHLNIVSREYHLNYLCRKSVDNDCQIILTWEPTYIMIMSSFWMSTGFCVTYLIIDGNIVGK